MPKYYHFVKFFLIFFRFICQIHYAFHGVLNAAKYKYVFPDQRNHL